MAVRWRSDMDAECRSIQQSVRAVTRQVVSIERYLAFLKIGVPNAVAARRAPGMRDLDVSSQQTGGGWRCWPPRFFGANGMTRVDMASSFDVSTTILPCAECGGEGRIWKSKYGGNDPDVWDGGQCEACDGSGNQTCERCGTHPANTTWKVHGKRYLVCRLCHDEWLADEL